MGLTTFTPTTISSARAGARQQIARKNAAMDVRHILFSWSMRPREAPDGRRHPASHTRWHKALVGINLQAPPFDCDPGANASASLQGGPHQRLPKGLRQTWRHIPSD